VSYRWPDGDARFTWTDIKSSPCAQCGRRTTIAQGGTPLHFGCLYEYVRRGERVRSREATWTEIVEARRRDRERR
jgi:hypothetical protein